MSNLATELDRATEDINARFDHHVLHVIQCRPRDKADVYLKSLSFVQIGVHGLELPRHVVARGVRGEDFTVLLIGGQLSVDENLELLEHAHSMDLTPQSTVRGGYSTESAKAFAEASARMKSDASVLSRILRSLRGVLSRKRGPYAT